VLNSLVTTKIVIFVVTIHIVNLTIEIVATKILVAEVIVKNVVFLGKKVIFSVAATHLTLHNLIIANLSPSILRLLASRRE